MVRFVYIHGIHLIWRETSEIGKMIISVQPEVMVEIRRGKATNREKVQTRFRINDSSSMQQSGVKLLAVYTWGC